MARTWLSISVRLVGGRGETCWPQPGRIFAVGPSHTFDDLAQAINIAFGRWDFSHLSQFELADGRIVTDPDSGLEAASGGFGPVQWPLDITKAKISKTVKLGDQFEFVFDLGDNWTHVCEVGTQKVDPLEVLGIRTKTPAAYWGWGTLPDQYGRRWQDDTGKEPVPPRPDTLESDLFNRSAHVDRLTMPEVVLLGQAIKNEDVDAFLTAIVGRDIDDALQHVAVGGRLLLANRGHETEALALSFVNRLNWRGADGDSELAADLLARLRGEPLAGQELSVDLERLVEIMEGDQDLEDGGWIDLESGAVYSSFEADPDIVGDDAAIDVDEDSERFLEVPHLGSHDAWQDMADFAAGLGDLDVQERLERAIDGKGAFRRFRIAIEDADLVDRWRVYKADRELGRARNWLAEEGIRAV